MYIYIYINHLREFTFTLREDSRFFAEQFFSNFANFCEICEN